MVVVAGVGAQQWPWRLWGQVHSQGCGSGGGVAEVVATLAVGAEPGK